MVGVERKSGASNIDERLVWENKGSYLRVTLELPLELSNRHNIYVKG